MMFLKTCWLTEENFERSSKYTKVFLQILTIETYPIMQLKEVYRVFNYLSYLVAASSICLFSNSLK